MMYWVIYDISDNKCRLKVSKICKNYGLVRVQKSSFLGTLTSNKAEMLAMEISEIIGKSEKDAAFLIPTCKSCSQYKIIIGHLDEEKVRDKDFYVVE